jgi:hypothetical protein
LRNAGAPSAQLSVLDPAQASAEAAYLSLGRPPSPTREQIGELKRRAALPPPRTVPIQEGRVEIELPANAVALLEVGAP